MTMFVVSVCPDNHRYLTGFLLNSAESLSFQIERAFSPGIHNRISQEDEIIMGRLLRMKELNISFERIGCYFGSGDPRIMPFGENKRNIGFVDPDDKNFGIYELCLVMSLYSDLRKENQTWYGISGCRMIYHFPENPQAEWDDYRDLGFERCFAPTSEICKFNRAKDWYLFPMFRLVERSDLFNCSISLENFLTLKTEGAWKNFFSSFAVSQKLADNRAN